MARRNEEKGLQRARIVLLSEQKWNQANCVCRITFLKTFPLLHLPVLIHLLQVKQRMGHFVEPQKSGLDMHSLHHTPFIYSLCSEQQRIINLGDIDKSCK